MNEHQRRSLTKLFRDLAVIFIAIALIANIIKPDIPVMKTIVLLVMSVVFTGVSLYLIRKS